MRSEALQGIDKPEIVSIIEREISLKKSGKYFIGRCPFHDDKNPSLIIYPDTQRFKCYGCQQSGDVIEFVRQYHGLSFREALQELCIAPLKQQRQRGLTHIRDTLKQVVMEIEYRTFLNRYSAMLACFLRTFNRMLLSKGIEVDPCELDDEELIQALPGILKNVQSIGEAEALAAWIHEARQWYRDIQTIHSRNEQARFQLFREVMENAK